MMKADYYVQARILPDHRACTIMLNQHMNTFQNSHQVKYASSLAKNSFAPCFIQIVYLKLYIFVFPFFTYHQVRRLIKLKQMLGGMLNS